MCKLDDLIEYEGYENEQEFGEAYITDSVVPGICMNEDCDYTTDVEPDCIKGFCEICGTQTVQSGFILMGVI